MIKEIMTRWKAESPIFWKKVFNFASIIGGSSVSVIGADKMFDLQSYGVPTIIFTIAGYIIVFCFALGLSAKLTKKDSNDTN